MPMHLHNEDGSVTVVSHREYYRMILAMPDGEDKEKRLREHVRLFGRKWLETEDTE